MLPPDFAPAAHPSTQEDWYLSQELPLHESFGSLQESAIQGCAFCRFVWLSIVNNCEVTIETLKSLTKGLIKVSILLKLFIGRKILVLTPKMNHEGETFLSSVGTECVRVESSEIELLRDIKGCHIKGGWYQLISVFSKTQLTYETDRLYAIHGLASILIQRLRAEYFNGLFRPTLAQGLLWYHDSNRREADKRPKDAQLPSWCWASACPISYLDIQETPIYVKDDHPERPLQFLPTHSEALSVIESTTSRLYIRAPIFQLTIGRSDVGYVKNVRSGHTESFPCRYFLDANRQVLQSMPQSSSVGGEWGQGVDVLWFPVGRDHHAYPYVPGLLVYEVPDEGKGVYRRCGLLQCGVSWLDEKDFEEVKEIILV
ncbi:hypothetical protein FOC1_g10006126 [Fusarium oxysporum f. sp. cubense race 1]|uniref:Heterokaryon incompatibility domain-containing protein n=1 Tax=Fusarium oxysporum f. sp. cubense (strain race 1) TaxID=1229664 RepID=N4U7X5_FUSC1|nr:hypothetical protein FOC1_g10006126 [Fusarium oxysporum f. sp. cubense race 1]